MMPIESRLRELLAEAKEQGKHLTKVVTAAEVDYFEVYNWLRRGGNLSVATAEKLHLTLTGRGFE